MLANEPPRFDLPEKLLEVLPPDPFDQLDVARKITSIALSTRVDALESELSLLRDHLADRDHIISGLESQLDSLDAALGEESDKLAAAQQEKESLMRENSQLSNSVKKLNRDVAKLEAFRKTLMRSLEDDEDNTTRAPCKAAAWHLQSKNSDEDASFPAQTNLNSSMQNHIHAAAEAKTSQPSSHGLLLAYQTITPQASPPRTPSSLSASVSPSRTPRPLSPRRHSISMSRGHFLPFNKLFSALSTSS